MTVLKRKLFLNGLRRRLKRYFDAALVVVAVHVVVVVVVVCMSFGQEENGLEGSGIT